MDTLAHGLWGGVGFYPHGTKKFTAALILGMSPDLFSFGLFHVTHPGWLKSLFAGEVSGPPPLAMLPEFVYHAYNLTHSLVIWAALFSLIWWIRRHPPWVFLAWGLHILCDIPTHSSRYFPTPYLWPFPTPFVEGISWATPWFMAANYTAIVLAYLGMLFYMRRKKRKPSNRAGGLSP
ncbi:MAG: hypothetical protein ACE5HC_08420 [Candidatus Binatia bacterium]